MSDEAIARPFGLVGFDEAGRFEHYCEMCNAEASFGFGVSLRAGELGRWFCAQHKPDDTFNPQHEQWMWDLLCYDGDGITMSPPTGPSDDWAQSGEARQAWRGAARHGGARLGEVGLGAAGVTKDRAGLAIGSGPVGSQEVRRSRDNYS